MSTERMTLDLKDRDIKGKVRTYGRRIFDDGGYSYAEEIIEIKTDATKIDLWDLYERNFERRCYCEHDCCGHIFSTVRKLEKHGKIITMKLGYAQNY